MTLTVSSPRTLAIDLPIDLPIDSTIPIDCPQLTFDSSHEPLNALEQAHFQLDLVRLGLDGTTWDILNGSIATMTANSRPKILRAYADNRLVGVAYFVECRRIYQSLLPQVGLGKLLDSIPIPMFFWVRYGNLVDAITNPGFVADGIDREYFIQRAIDHLKTQYLYGGVLDIAATGQSRAGSVIFPFCDAGIIEIQNEQCLDRYYQQHKNLRRKVNKFNNKNGRIEILTGPMPDAIAHRAADILDSLDPLILAPFQDNYTAMALRACQDAKTVHILAWIDDQMVGYQSFAISGQILHCLSGAFDRTLKRTYHAYENIILASIDYAIAQQLQRIEYGPILNPTKVSMMSDYRPCEQQYYSRFNVLRQVFKFLIPRTRLAPTILGPYAGLEHRSQSE
jgi:Acetyltransferase (GNAT) domain